MSINDSDLHMVVRLLVGRAWCLQQTRKYGRAPDFADWSEFTAEHVTDRPKPVRELTPYCDFLRRTCKILGLPVRELQEYSRAELAQIAEVTARTLESETDSRLADDFPRGFVMDWREAYLVTLGKEWAA